MAEERKHYDLSRIAENAGTLSNDIAYECFMYECDDFDGFEEVEDEIEDIADLLPEGISVADLPNILVGNKRTKVFGRGDCSATEGHLIISENESRRQMFADVEEALALGFRPCSKCMPTEYKKWKAGIEKANKDSK